MAKAVHLEFEKGMIVRVKQRHCSYVAIEYSHVLFERSATLRGLGFTSEVWAKDQEQIVSDLGRLRL